MNKQFVATWNVHGRKEASHYRHVSRYPTIETSSVRGVVGISVER